LQDPHLGRHLLSRSGGPFAELRLLLGEPFEARLDQAEASFDPAGGERKEKNEQERQRRDRERRAEDQ